MKLSSELELAHEEFGDPSGPCVLLIMGNSAPGLVWPDAFCHSLVGFRVIRYDQRDTGLSSYFDFERTPYTLDTLVSDAFALLDGLGIEKAHLVGLSQGGMIGYRMSLQKPQRVLSLTALMTSTDQRPKNDAFSGAPPRPGELSRPASDYVARVIALNSTPAEDPAQRFVENFRLASGPNSPFDEQAWQALGQAVADLPTLRTDGLTPSIANHSNHTRAQKATPPIEPEELASLKIPVLILHGNEDPIFPPDHAVWAARLIPGATLQIIDKMGHALDPAFFPILTNALRSFWV